MTDFNATDTWDFSGKNFTSSDDNQPDIEVDYNVKLPDRDGPSNEDTDEDTWNYDDGY